MMFREHLLLLRGVIKGGRKRHGRERVKVEGNEEQEKGATIQFPNPDCQGVRLGIKMLTNWHEMHTVCTTNIQTQRNPALAHTMDVCLPLLILLVIYLVFNADTGGTYLLSKVNQHSAIAYTLQ